VVIQLGVQFDMVDFALNSVARSIGVSRYTCITLLEWSIQFIEDRPPACDEFYLQAPYPGFALVPGPDWGFSWRTIPFPNLDPPLRKCYVGVKLLNVYRRIDFFAYEFVGVNVNRLQYVKSVTDDDIALQFLLYQFHVKSSVTEALPYL